MLVRDKGGFFLDTLPSVISQVSHNGYDCFQGGKTYVPRWSLLFRGRYEEEQQAGCGKNYGTDPHLYALELGDTLKRERRQKNRSLP